MDRMFRLIVASCARVAANHRGEGTDPPDGTPSSVAVFLGAKDTISSGPTASAKRSSIRQVGPIGVVVREVGADDEILFSALHTASVYRLADSGSASRLELYHTAPSGILALAQDGEGCVYASDATSIWLVADNVCSRPEPGQAAVTADASPLAFGSPGEFYALSCAGCHGADRGGIGGLGPSLLRFDRSDDFYFDTIAEGRPGTLMPSWRAAGLSDDDIRVLVAWLKAEGR